MSNATENLAALTSANSIVGLAGKFWRINGADGKPVARANKISDECGGGWVVINRGVDLCTTATEEAAVSVLAALAIAA